MPTPKKCWNCGQETMLFVAEALHPYRKCSACGATDVDIPKVSAPAFSDTDDITPALHGNIRTRHMSVRRRKSKHD